MSTLQRGILKYYIDGKFFQRIEEAKTPEELDSIYNELNADWEKEVVPISQDILDLFACNKHISKELFAEVIYKFTGNRLEFFKKIYIELENYEFIKFDDLFCRVSILSAEYEEFLNYVIEKKCKISDVLLFVIKACKVIEYSEEQITYIWERRNEISDNDQKKLFVKKILKQRNVSKKILFQAFDEFKNDIDIVVEFFVNGIEYPEIFSKVLEKFHKDVILEKIKSNLNSTDEDDEEFAYCYPQDVHILMSVARIADDNTLKRILNIFKKNYYTFPNKEIFNSQDKKVILGEPRLLDSYTHSKILIKIMLSMTKNPNASLDTLKYIVQSTNDIETLYYCIVNSGRNLEIFELIDMKGLSPVQEHLKNNEVIARFEDEMQEYIDYVKVRDILKAPIFKKNPLSVQKAEKYDIKRDIEDRIRRSSGVDPIYCMLAMALSTLNEGNRGIVMDKIRESIKNLSFEKIALNAYSSEDFKDLQLKEKAYFECLINYGLVNDNDVRNFLETCLGEKYLRRYERDIALFNEQGLDLSQTSKGAPQRGGF